MRRSPVLASFREPHGAAAAARALRARGFRVGASMSTPFADVMEAIAKPPSPISRVVPPAALAGVAVGVLLTTCMSLDWPMVTGGKPIVSAPAFAIVVFELAILVTALATLVALGVGAWRGGAARAFPEAGALDPDRIDLVAAGGDPAEAERVLRGLGAEGVRRVP